MKDLTRRITTLARLAAVLAVAFTAACASSRPPSALGSVLATQQRPIAQAMEAAAKRAGTAVNRGSLTQATGNGASIVVAATAGMESIPATRLPEGVDAAFAYLDLPRGAGGVQPNVPAGFYRLRVKASMEAVNAALAASGGVPPDTTTFERRPGVQGADVALINERGATVATFPAVLSVFALTPPREAPFPRTFVEPIIGARYVNVCIVCSNGWRFCVEMDWFDFVMNFL